MADIKANVCGRGYMLSGRGLSVDPNDPKLKELLELGLKKAETRLRDGRVKDHESIDQFFDSLKQQTKDGQLVGVVVFGLKNVKVFGHQLVNEVMEETAQVACSSMASTLALIAAKDDVCRVMCGPVQAAKCKIERSQQQDKGFA